jgi:diguanylate cyclase (GGDEF)-like protein
MKIRPVNGARHPAVGSGPGVRRPPGPSVDPAPARLEQALSEAPELERALATSQRQLRVVQERVETLVKRDSRLKQRFLRLARREAQVRHVAYHDELTGLPNRSLLLDRFNQAVAQGARHGRQVALLFLDLDGFKTVNDRFGHAAGDKLLQQVAGRLAACIRAGDTACRYGGDEFVIMLPEVGGEVSAATVAEKIRVHLVAPYVVDGGTVTVTASIGTAVYPVDGQDYGSLIQQSDIGMYRAKARSRATSRLQPATKNRPSPDAIECGHRRSGPVSDPDEPP